MTMSVRWSIASAKAELSHVVRLAHRRPQVIERRGEAVAIVLGIEEYRRLAAGDELAARWAAFLEQSASLRAEGGIELDIPRRTARTSPFARRKSR